MDRARLVNEPAAPKYSRRRGLRTLPTLSRSPRPSLVSSKGRWSRAIGQPFHLAGPPSIHDRGARCLEFAVCAAGGGASGSRVPAVLWRLGVKFARLLARSATGRHQPANRKWDRLEGDGRAGVHQLSLFPL